MKLTRDESGLSFTLKTKNALVGINSTKGDMQLFLTEQSKDSKGLFHWPGEYEMEGISFFLSPLVGDFSIGRLFIEGVRIVCFNDKGLTEVTDDLLKTFGNADVLIVEKSDEGLNKADMKKLLEKVDPRILIACKGSTAIALKEYSYPFTESESVTISKSSLPNEISEYIIL